MVSQVSDRNNHIKQEVSKKEVLISQHEDAMPTEPPGTSIFK